MLVNRKTYSKEHTDRIDRSPGSLALRLALGAMVAFAALAPLAPSEASALSISFDSLLHGEVVSDQLAGLSIDANNPHRSFDLAVGFDSRESNTSDRDLQASLPGPDYWSAGNIKNLDLGIILILQENKVGCESGTGICSDPDDEGHRPAGYLGFDFDIPVRDFGFDLVDIESITAEHATIELIDELADGSTLSQTVDLMEYLDMGSNRYDASIVFGNNSANRFAAITAASVGLDEFDRVVLHLGGSGAIDNIQGAAVPEPGTALLIALGLAGLAVRRR